MRLQSLLILSLVSLSITSFFLFNSSLCITSVITFGLRNCISRVPPIKADMEEAATQEEPKFVYSVWAIPPEDVTEKLKKVMEGLRLEFNGPEFRPHVTVVGAINLTEADAAQKFKSVAEGLKPYKARVHSVSTGTFFYQCVYLLLHPDSEVLEAGAHCSDHFGYKASTPYMPHLSLLYADITEDEKQKAKKKAEALDKSISSLSFTISRLALYKTDTADKTLKSWEKVAECELV